MTLPHQKFREIVFVLLFARSHGVMDEKALEQLVMEQLKASRSNIVKCLEVAQEIERKYPEIDQEIQSQATSYDFERIQAIEKTILRMGTYDILFNSELPPPIVIAEALRLTKKFATPAAVSFVNAILDGILKMHKIRPPEKGNDTHTPISPSESD